MKRNLLLGEKSLSSKKPSYGIIARKCITINDNGCKYFIMKNDKISIKLTDGVTMIGKITLISDDGFHIDCSSKFKSSISFIKYSNISFITIDDINVDTNEENKIYTDITLTTDNSCISKFDIVKINTVNGAEYIGKYIYYDDLSIMLDCSEEFESKIIEIQYSERRSTYRNNTSILLSDIKSISILEDTE